MIRFLEPSATGYDNPDCYLRGQGCCTQKTTNEHPISEGVITAAVGCTADVIGPKWNRRGRPIQLRPRSLGANILCEAHNSALAGLDAEAKKLIEFIAALDPEVSQPTSVDVKEVDGNYVERWILKALVGGLVSGITTINKRSLKDAIPPQQWIDWIVGRDDLPQGMGLIVSDKKQRLTPFVGLAPHYHKKTGHPMGATVTLYGLDFTVIACNYKFVAGMGPLRPRGMRLLHAKGTSEVAFRWPDHYGTTSVMEIPTLSPDTSLPHETWERAVQAQGLQHDQR